MTDRCQCDGCKGLSYITHASSCAVHNAPALPVGPCNCVPNQGEGFAPPEPVYFLFAIMLAVWIAVDAFAWINGIRL